MPLPGNHLSLIKHQVVILGINNPGLHSNNLIQRVVNQWYSGIKFSRIIYYKKLIFPVLPGSPNFTVARWFIKNTETTDLLRFVDRLKEEQTKLGL